MPGVKITAKIYEETVLRPIVKPLNDTLFKEQHWIFQQDSGLPHTSATQCELHSLNYSLYITHKDYNYTSYIIFYVWNACMYVNNQLETSYLTTIALDISAEYSPAMS